MVTTPTQVAAALLFLVSLGNAPAAAHVTAITGATLIDGTGRAPVKDAVIILQDNKIAAVGTRADVPIPEGAHRIDATGTFVIPGPFGRDFNGTAETTVTKALFKRIRAIWEENTGPDLMDLTPELLRPEIRTYISRGIAFDGKVVDPDSLLLKKLLQVPR